MGHLLYLSFCFLKKSSKDAKCTSGKRSNNHWNLKEEAFRGVWILIWYRGDINTNYQKRGCSNTRLWKSYVKFSLFKCTKTRFCLHGSLHWLSVWKNIHVFQLGSKYHPHRLHKQIHFLKICLSSRVGNFSYLCSNHLWIDTKIFMTNHEALQDPFYFSCKICLDRIRR